jgi:hypothetical protein
MRELDVYLKGKRVGKIKKIGRVVTYETWRDYHRHYFWKVGGYGISVKILNILRANHIEQIIVHETWDVARKDIMSKFKWWDKYGSKIHINGYDEQIVLANEQIVKLGGSCGHTKKLTDYNG